MPLATSYCHNDITTSEPTDTLDTDRPEIVFATKSLTSSSSLHLVATHEAILHNVNLDNQISVVSLPDDDDNISSSAYSDSDVDEIEIDIEKNKTLDCSNFNDNNLNILPQNGNSFFGQAIANATVQPPAFGGIGSIALQNTSDVTFGNKTYYQGPVTLQQFLLNGNNEWEERKQTSNDTTKNGNFLKIK